jgi:hypothetical protein
VFCDLVGSTARAEAMDPEDVRALLSSYHERVRSRLERFGGTVEKFIGDAVMALFGAPSHTRTTQSERCAPLLQSASGRRTRDACRCGSASRRASARSPSAPTTWTLEQQIQFRAARDGVRLAYASHGRGPPIVKAPNWLTHIEFDWKSPLWRPWLEALSETNRVIRYDERGAGLSDWEVEDFSLFSGWRISSSGYCRKWKTVALSRGMSSTRRRSLSESPTM